MKRQPPIHCPAFRKEEQTMRFVDAPDMGLNAEPLSTKEPVLPAVCERTIHPDFSMGAGDGTGKGVRHKFPPMRMLMSMAPATSIFSGSFHPIAFASISPYFAQVADSGGISMNRSRSVAR